MTMSIPMLKVPTNCTIVSQKIPINLHVYNLFVYKYLRRMMYVVKFISVNVQQVFNSFYHFRNLILQTLNMAIV